jgi:protease I
MAGTLDGKRVAILFTDGVEQVEYTQPRDALREAGATTEVLSIKPEPIQGFNHLDKGDTFAVEMHVKDAKPGDFDALVLPGGVANPDALRLSKESIAFIRDFAAQDKPIAAICHGPWTLIDAGVAEGKHMTSWPTLKTDLRNAGAEWTDEKVVVDGKLVTSRKPDDIPAFNDALWQQVEGTAATRKAA